VDVRRSSDDAEDSFTASDVADGTLTDWVNTNTLSTARNYTTQPFETFTGASSSGFTASNSSANGFAGWDTDSGVSGNVIKVSFDLNITSGSPKISLRQAYNNNILASNENIEYTTSGSYTATLTASGNFSFIAFTEGDIPSSFTVSNFKILRDGFVSKWYDQSGNANHATQGTNASQPKIVDAGSLVSGGLDFDGASNYLELASAISLQDNSAIFSALTTSASSKVAGFLNRSNNAQGININANGFFSRAIGAGNSGSFLFSNNTSEKLVSSLVSSESVTAFQNGAASVDNPKPEALSSNSPNQIGGNGNGSQYWIGQIQEVIIYKSDQSDNRTAIEANIGDTYNIDLPSGVDTGYDQVDGFVETWYDQSGNGNDAVQQVSGSQPKIVDAGVLVSGGLDFDGVDDYLVTTQGLIVEISQNPASVFCVAHPNNTNEGYLLTEGDSPASTYSSQFILNGATTATATVWVNATQFGSGFPASKTLGGFIYNGTTFQAYLNGSADGSAGTADINAETIFQTFIATRADATTDFFDGKVEELITYKSDQSANRVAIETNINNQYDIY
jgi:hypothetical protein